MYLDSFASILLKQPLNRNCRNISSIARARSRLTLFFSRESRCAYIKREMDTLALCFWCILERRGLPRRRRARERSLLAAAVAARRGRRGFYFQPPLAVYSRQHTIHRMAYIPKNSFHLLIQQLNFSLLAPHLRLPQLFQEKMTMLVPPAARATLFY